MQSERRCLLTAEFQAWLRVEPPKQEKSGVRKLNGSSRQFVLPVFFRFRARMSRPDLDWEARTLSIARFLGGRLVFNPVR